MSVSLVARNEGVSASLPRDDSELLAEIREQIAELPSYGQRRACALVNRQRPAGSPRVNPERADRVVAGNGLLLPKAPQRARSSRPHNGVVAVPTIDTRWCSDGLGRRRPTRCSYLGGERAGGKAGRGSENKAPFVAAIPVTKQGRPMYLKLSLVVDSPLQAIGNWAKANLAPGTLLRSDGLGCFAAVADADCLHMPIMVGALEPRDLPEFKWVNTVLGNLKTTLAGAFHALNCAASPLDSSSTWRAANRQRKRSSERLQRQVSNQAES